MEVLHPRCAGLDVHKDSIVAAVRLAGPGGVRTEVRRFDTTTPGLLALGAWLAECGCTHAAMESTGVYWKPVWHVLSDGDLTLVLANAAQVKNVPGRKTDVADAALLADLLAHGLAPATPEEATSMTPAFNVLFLCTRNSARSLMAEAILEKLGGGRFRAYSAGSDPAPEPMPDVFEKLRALRHDASGLRCKSWNEFAHRDAPRMDFVIALCDTLRGQDCPDFGDRAVTASWPLPGPAKLAGGTVDRALLLGSPVTAPTSWPPSWRSRPPSAAAPA